MCHDVQTLCSEGTLGRAAVELAGQQQLIIRYASDKHMPWASVACRDFSHGYLKANNAAYLILFADF